MAKGTYESPLKRFARQNEGNVLSSGDSGSNLGSVGDRELIKTVGHGAGKASFDGSSEKHAYNLHFIDDVETEEKFTHNPTAYPRPISTMNISFDPATFSRHHGNHGELTASSMFVTRQQQ